MWASHRGRRRSLHPVTVFLSVALCAASAAQPPARRASPTYAHDIRPILQARCVVCHNHETLSTLTTSGGLDLGSYEMLLKGVVTKEGGRSILTGSKAPGAALIDRLCTTSPTRLMPRGGPPLPPDQIELFKKWIAAGAPAGAAAELRGSASVSVAAVPDGMPPVAAVQDVSFTTLLKAPTDLLPKPAPKDPAVTLALHVGPLPGITSICYSPDGSVLAVGGYRAVTLWSTKTGQPTACITHLAGPVQALAFRPDGSQLAIAGGLAGYPGELRVVDMKSPVAIAGTSLIKGHTEAVLSVAWSPDGTRIATGSQDRTARIWEWPSGKELRSFKDHGDAVTRVCFSPDGKSLYTASMDHNLRRFDVANGTLTRTFTGHNEPINAMAITLDGKRLISSGSEPNLRWWNTDTGDITNNNGGHTGPVNELSMSKDGKLLVSVSADKTARIWDVNNTGQQRSLEGSTDWVYTAAFSPDSKFTAGAGADGVVRIWETASGRLRLMLVSWPEEKSPLPDWVAITPEGLFDGSASWTALLRPQLAGAVLAAASPQLAAWGRTLHQPESLVKAWQ